MKRFGLIGHPLQHSFSAEYFTEKFEREHLSGCVYQNFDLPSIAEFTDLIVRYPDLSGLNVTIPYKQSILSYLDDLSPDAREIGAVNTICRVDGRLVGHNTDWQAFRQSLTTILDEGVEISSALILGTGGSARAVAYALSELGISHNYISRSPRDGMYTYETVPDEVFANTVLIVNATPVGMVPQQADRPPLNYDLLTPRHLLYDLIYNPPVTRFLQSGEETNARTKNGLEMLHLQAEASWSLWMRYSD